MSTIHARFLQAMAAFLNGVPAGLDTANWPIEEWKALYRLARRQSLSGALCTALGSAPMPEAASSRLRRDAFQMLARYEAQREIVTDIAAAFGAAGIDHLFFKGAVVREYYAQPAMRSMGDVDLVIRPDTANEAHKAMLALGFVCEEKSGEVWSYTRREYLVEMHLVVRRYDVHRQEAVWYDDPFADAVPTDGTTYRWSDAQEAAHAVMHLAAHFCAGGCGLRQWMDVAVLCARFPQEALWRAVYQRLKPFGMHHFLEHALAVCCKWFDAPAPTALCRPLDEETTATLLSRVLQDGTFGADQRLMIADARKERRRQKDNGRFMRAVRWVFPETSYIRTRFPYAARHGVLLPVAYVHRLAKGVTKHRRTHLQRMQYAREQQGDLEREVAFFDALGL